MNHKNLKSRRESKYKRIIRKERIKMERKLKKKQNIQRLLFSLQTTKLKMELKVMEIEINQISVRINTCSTDRKGLLVIGITSLLTEIFDYVIHILKDLEKKKRRNH